MGSDPTGPTGPDLSVQKKRDQRIAVAEAIGCALASLKRTDYVWCDDDVRDALTRVRATLATAQSQIKERINT